MLNDLLPNIARMLWQRLPSTLTSPPPSLGFALVTTGGFVTTNDQQVLNDDYQPIEGLYASGNTCGMRFGPEYVTPIPGVSIGMCLTLGRELGKYLAAK